MIRLVFVVLTMCSVSSSFAASTVYKWVDKDGKVQYGDPTSLPVAPDNSPNKKAEGSANTKSKGVDDSKGNRVVDRAERAPTSGTATNTGKFSEPQRIQVPSSPNPSYVAPYPGDYNSSNYNAARQHEAEQRYAEQQRLQQEAADNRRQQLIAECERQRGTDCRNESTLRYMEDSQQPRLRYR